MKPILLIALLVFCYTALAQSKQSAAELADEVFRASGGDVWPDVERIRFTFVVEQDGKPVTQAEHDWDVKRGTDTVTWNGKTVTVNLTGPHETDEQKAAFQRWTNDSYWLLAPIKVKDPGVHAERRGTQSIDGKEHEVLHLSFDGVGLTPGDQYDLYVDPETHLVRAWDYMPNPEKKVRSTWEDYENFNGLVLSTKHRIGDRTIRFQDVEVKVAGRD